MDENTEKELQRKTYGVFEETIREAVLEYLSQDETQHLIEKTINRVIISNDFKHKLESRAQDAIEESVFKSVYSRLRRKLSNLLRYNGD